MPCSICDDTGWKPVEADGIRRVVRCDCWRAGLTTRLLDDARIQPRYRKCELNNFVTYPNEGLAAAVAHARRFVDQFPAVDKGLFFIGPHGIGKTHLAVGILKEIVKKTGARTLFYDTTDLLREIRHTYNATVRAVEMDILRPVLEADLLVLDDIGKDRFSEWVEETMNLIVNTRYNERKTTIFTSNFEDNPDVEDPNALKVRVGLRIHSRLNEMCSFVEYDGADYRHRPPNAGDEDLVMLWKRNPRRRTSLPNRTEARAKAQLKPPKELGWSGGKAST
jgi:DNA replication protein DnaC